jgi:glycosyltransferase involved in cell wall biosynthesis
MISVVIPAYNEEAAIGGTLDELRSVQSGTGTPFEVIVVDDGSSDKTADVAVSHGARVVRHPHNIGYGRSIKDGIAAASNDVIAIIDADGTYPADQIPHLVERLETGFDLVIGVRSGIRAHDSAFKNPMRRLLTFLVEFTTGRQVPDVNSGLRVFRRSTVQTYFPRLCETFSFTTSMTLAYMLTHRFVGYVPIAYRERVGTTKVRLFRDSLRTLQYIVEGIVYYNPIKMFLLLAALALLLGFVSAGILLITAGYGAGLVAAIGLLAALLIFALGLLADLLRQILIR